MPTLEVKKEISDSDFNMKITRLLVIIIYGLEKKHQYLFLSKFAYYHKKFIDIGVLGIHKDSTFGKYLSNNLIKKNNNLYINDINHPLDIYYFLYMVEVKKIY